MSELGLAPNPNSGGEGGGNPANVDGGKGENINKDREKVYRKIGEESFVFQEIAGPRPADEDTLAGPRPADEYQDPFVDERNNIGSTDALAGPRPADEDTLAGPRPADEYQDPFVDERNNIGSTESLAGPRPADEDTLAGPRPADEDEDILGELKTTGVNVAINEADIRNTALLQGREVFERQRTVERNVFQYMLGALTAKGREKNEEFRRHVDRMNSRDGKEGSALGRSIKNTFKYGILKWKTQSDIIKKQKERIEEEGLGSEDAIIERFSEEGALMLEATEKKDKVSGEKTMDLRDKLAELAKAYNEGLTGDELNAKKEAYREAADEYRARMMAEKKGDDWERLKGSWENAETRKREIDKLVKEYSKKEHFVDNFEELGSQFEMLAEHKVGQDALDEFFGNPDNFTFFKGENARTGLAQREVIDSATKMAMSTVAGGAVAAGILMGARSATRKVLGVGAGAAIFGGIRGFQKGKEKLAKEGAEMALEGKDLSENMNDKERARQFGGMLNANKAKEELTQMVEELGEHPSAEQKEALMAKFAEIQGRREIQWRGGKEVQLLSYDVDRNGRAGEQQAEIAKQALELSRALRETERALRVKCGVRGELDDMGRNVALQARVEEWKESFVAGEMSEGAKARRKYLAGQAVKGAVVGAGIGVAMSGMREMINGGFDDVSGLESETGGGEYTGFEDVPKLNTVELKPEAEEGEYTAIIGGKEIHDLTFENTGELTDDGMDKITKAGFDLEPNMTKSIEVPDGMVRKEVGVVEYMENNGNLVNMTNVQTVEDSDISMGQWRIDTQTGDIIAKVNGEGAEDMQVLLSPEKGGAQAIALEVGDDGYVRIPAKSGEASMFMVDSNGSGRALFEGSSVKVVKIGENGEVMLHSEYVGAHGIDGEVVAVKVWESTGKIEIPQYAFKDENGELYEMRAPNEALNMDDTTLAYINRLANGGGEGLGGISTEEGAMLKNGERLTEYKTSGGYNQNNDAFLNIDAKQNPYAVNAPLYDGVWTGREDVEDMANQLIQNTVTSPEQAVLMATGMGMPGTEGITSEETLNALADQLRANPEQYDKFMDDLTDLYSKKMEGGSIALVDISGEKYDTVFGYPGVDKNMVLDVQHGASHEVNHMLVFKTVNGENIYSGDGLARLEQIYQTEIDPNTDVVGDTTGCGQLSIVHRGGTGDIDHPEVPPAGRVTPPGGGDTPPGGGDVPPETPNVPPETPGTPDVPPETPDTPETPNVPPETPNVPPETPNVPPETPDTPNVPPETPETPNVPNTPTDEILGKGPDPHSGDGTPLDKTEFEGNDEIVERTDWNDGSKYEAGSEVKTPINGETAAGSSAIKEAHGVTTENGTPLTDKTTAGQVVREGHGGVATAEEIQRTNDGVASNITDDNQATMHEKVGGHTETATHEEKIENISKPSNAAAGSATQNNNATQEELANMLKQEMARAGGGASSGTGVSSGSVAPSGGGGVTSGASVGGAGGAGYSVPDETNEPAT